MTDNTIPLGVYVGNPNASDPVEEKTFEAEYYAFTNLMGKQAQFLTLYIDQRQPISQWASNAGWEAWSSGLSPVASKLIPSIGFPMASGAAGADSPDQTYKDFAAGKYDDLIRTVVKEYADAGFSTQYWRPGWEFNLNFQPHYAGDTPSVQNDWVAAFQHISDVMHASAKELGVNLSVVWNPSIVNWSGANALSLYPGDKYVDVISADVYDDPFPYSDSDQPGLVFDWSKSGQTYNPANPVFSTLKDWASDPINLEHYYTYPAAGRWQSDQSGGHALSLQNLMDFAGAHNKPFGVSETGAGSNPTDNPVFVKWLANTLAKSTTPVAFVNVWNSNGGGNYEFSDPENHKPQEAQAWQQSFGANNPQYSIAVSDMNNHRFQMNPIPSGNLTLNSRQTGLDQDITQSIGKDGTLTVSTPLWNDVRTISIADTGGKSYATNAFMETNISLSGAKDQAKLVLTSAKRGIISLTEGNYNVLVTAHSNGADPVVNGVQQSLNSFVFTLGSGNDTIRVNGDGDQTKVQLTTGSGHAILYGTQGGNQVTFGSGRAEVTGGKGIDQYKYQANSGIDIIQNFDPSRDTLTVASSLKSSMHTDISASKTILWFGNTSHQIVLTGVQFDPSQIVWSK